MRLDKALHFITSYSLTLSTALYLPLWVAVAATLIVGVGKEVFDKVSGKGSAEFGDLLADVAGILVAALAVLLSR